jgi:hypothetical protein
MHCNGVQGITVAGFEKFTISRRAFLTVAIAAPNRVSFEQRIRTHITHSSRILRRLVIYILHA